MTDCTRILAFVAAQNGTTPDRLRSRSRAIEVLWPRQLAMYLCRRYTNAPLTTIARAFGRDHPSASNAIRAVERRILENTPFRDHVQELSARLDAMPEIARVRPIATRRSLRPISFEEMVERGPIVLLEKWLDRHIAELKEIKRKLSTIEAKLEEPAA